MFAQPYSVNRWRSRLLAAAVAVIPIGSMVGCQRAESPATVSKNVANAEQQDASHTARALQDASHDIAKAQQKVAERQIERDNVEAKDSYKVALAKADGNHDVALQECKAVAGDAQRRCKQQADADYDAAKANAKALEVSRTE